MPFACVVLRRVNLCTLLACGRNESAHDVSLPASRVHDGLQGGAPRLLHQGEDALGLTALARWLRVRGRCGRLKGLLSLGGLSWSQAAPPAQRRAFVAQREY